MGVLTVSADGHEFFERIETYLSLDQLARVRDAFEYACQKHGPQLRKSGEPYYTHPTTVAYYLAGYQLDANALIAALLHDVAEDTPASVPELNERFGYEVSQIVDGVTKFKASVDDKPNGGLSAEQQATATISKLFRFMTRDVRVVLIKLFDRLHNMRTIKSMKLHKQVSIAQETLYVYAPLANRLGMWAVKNELEYRSFEVLNKQDFDLISQQVGQRHQEHYSLYVEVQDRLEAVLSAAGIEIMTIAPSLRNPYSLYKRARQQKNGQSIQVDHIPRILIVLNDKLACYTALGIIHGLWQPKPGEFDDYIARPRENLYRALHTTVLHDNGQPVKLRLRTQAMSIISEIGVLARWAHVGQNVSADMRREVSEQVEALFANIDNRLQIEQFNPDDAVKGVVEDMLSAQITVYTPKGERRELPQGATPLDFAYKIHTDIGNNCWRAYVNNELTALNAPLRDGDTVRIVRRQQHPQRIWLDEELGYLHTSSARGHVRRWFRRLPHEEAIRQGRELLEAEMLMIGFPMLPHEAIAKQVGFETARQLYYALGHAELMSTTVARRVLNVLWQDRRLRQIGRTVRTRTGHEYIILGANSVKEHPHLCLNCQPTPGDTILGFQRKGKRLTIHAIDCHLLPSDARANRLLQLRWGEASVAEMRQVDVEIEVYDRPFLLYEISGLLHADQINIAAANTPRVDGEIRINLSLEINSPEQLVRIMHRIHALVNVRAAHSLPSAPPHLNGHVA